MAEQQLRLLSVLGATVILICLWAQQALAATPAVTLPVPRATIAQGQVITLSALEKRRFRANRIDRFSVVPNINDLLGKEAVRQLPVGEPIPKSALRRA